MGSMGRELKCCTVSFVFYCVAFAIFIAGAASPQWYKIEYSDSTEINTGVFWWCEQSPGDECKEVEGADRWWRGCAAMLATTAVLGAVAGVTAMFPAISALLQMTGGAVGIIGSIIFIVWIEDDYEKYPTVETELMWGFFLALIGAGLLLLNGLVLGIMFLATRCKMTLVCCCYGDFQPYKTLP